MTEVASLSKVLPYLQIYCYIYAVIETGILYFNLIKIENVNENDLFKDSFHLKIVLTMRSLQ